MDYKSGQLPGDNVKNHLAPQLTLKRLFARWPIWRKRRKIVGAKRGADLFALERTHARSRAEKPAADDKLIDGALDKLASDGHYDNEAQPYLVHIRPRPRFGLCHLNDMPFDHLARCPECKRRRSYEGAAETASGP